MKSVYTEIEQTFKKNDNFFMIEKKIGHIETGPNIFSNIFCILIHKIFHILKSYIHIWTFWTKVMNKKTILCTYVFVGARICLIFLVIIVLKIAKSLRL